MFKQTKKAFTLLELVVILVAIGILSTLGYQKFSEVILESKSIQLANQLNKIEVGINKYYAELGTFPVDTIWLAASARPATVEGYDALGLKINGEGGEDVDVMEYWSGPYINDMPVKKNDSGDVLSILAVFGDDIEICAKVTVDNSITDGCASTYTAEDSFINAFIIKGVDPQAIPYLFKAVNGRDMSEAEKTDGNAYEVVFGSAIEKLGIPTKSSYATAPFLVYRFTENIQN